MGVSNGHVTDNVKVLWAVYTVSCHSDSLTSCLYSILMYYIYRTVTCFLLPNVYCCHVVGACRCLVIDAVSGFSFNYT